MADIKFNPGWQDELRREINEKWDTTLDELKGQPIPVVEATLEDAGFSNIDPDVVARISRGEDVELTITNL